MKIKIFLMLLSFIAPSVYADDCAQISREMSRCIAADLNGSRTCQGDRELPERCRNTSAASQGFQQGVEDAKKAQERDEKSYFEGK